MLGCAIDDVIEPAWREWWDAGGPKPPTTAQIAAAREESFKPSPGRPRVPSRVSHPATATERLRRELISKAMKQHWAEKKAQQDESQDG